MKLTRRGGDFLRAILAGTLIATVLTTKIVLALCLALVLAGLISEIILARSNSQYVGVKPVKSHLSCFKGEEITTAFSVSTRNHSFIGVSVKSLDPPEGVNVELERYANESFEVKVIPKFAGRFSGISVTLELNDPLRLFAKKINFSSKEFVLDSYPSSVLKEVPEMRPAPISFGELEGKTQGFGMEFYSADKYSSFTERKNIFWKKVASSSDERLLVKTRAANIRKSIAISFIITNRRGHNNIEWIDSACEALATLGKTILDFGCEAKINFDIQGKIVSRLVVNLKELSEAIMEMSTASLSDLDNVSSLLEKGDICVTGYNEVRNNLFASAIAKKTTLLIQDEGDVPERLSEHAMVYEPFQDFGGFVGSVTGV